MRKRIVSFVLVVVFALSLSVSVSAISENKTATLAFRNIKITLNGEELVPRDATGSIVDPFIIDGTTYLPVRAVARALGIGVEWDGANSTIKLSKFDPDVLSFTMNYYDEEVEAAITQAILNEWLSGVERAPVIEDRTAELAYRDIKITLNGKEITPRDAAGNVVEPFIIDGTTYLPVRAVADALGLSVEWDGAAFTVKLSESGGAPADSDPAPAGSYGPHRDRAPDTIVYVSSRSHTIHSVHDCSGMKKYTEMTIADAEAKGYDYCPNCW